MKQRTKDILISLFLLLGVALLPLLFLFLALPWVTTTNAAGIVTAGSRGFDTIGGSLVTSLVVLAIVVGIIAAIKIPQYHRKSASHGNFLTIFMFVTCIVIAILSFMTLTLEFPVGTVSIPQGVNAAVGAILTGVIAIVIALLYLLSLIFLHIKGLSELELRIDDLKKLLEKHYITEEQFEASKAKLLEELV